MKSHAEKIFEYLLLAPDETVIYEALNQIPMNNLINIRNMIDHILDERNQE